MSQTVADHPLGRLREWGVDTVFGSAAFDAVGYARFSGWPLTW
jgi:hypothetical protein